MTTQYRRARSRKPEPSTPAAYGSMYGVKIGRFRIAPHRAGRIWIGDPSCNEGRDFSEAELEAVIGKFYGMFF